MIDFAKLSTPEAKEKMKQDREIRQQLLDKKDTAIRFQCDKLFEMIIEGEIENEYDIEFIKSVHSRLKRFVPLTEKQETYLEKLYHDKY